MIQNLNRWLSVCALLFLTACSGSGSGSEGTSAANPPPTQPAAGAPGTIVLDAESYAVPQNAGSVDVNVKRTAGAAGAVTVSYATTAGSALPDSDYTPAVGTLSWDDGDTSTKTVAIALNEGAEFSGTREFTFGLTSTSGGATIGAPGSAAIRVSGSAVPTSAGTLSLSAATYSVAQNGGVLTVSVNRTGGSDGAVSISYATQPGTAVAGTDFTSASGTLSWASGDSSAKSFNVNVSNAAPYSGSKNFSIKLSSPTGGASVGELATATATITGSAAPPEAGALTLSSAAYTVAQTSGSLTVSVSRTGGSAGTVAVRYATSNGTATAGTDYTSKTGTLTWAAGDTAAKTFTIAVSNTSPFTGSKTFSIALSNATNGSVLGAPSSATVTINGGATAGALKLSAAAYSVTQGTPSVAVTVTRTGGSSGAVRVNYATANGTGSSGTHYSSTTGTLSWANGETAAKTITVPIGTTPFSGTRTFTVTLSGVTGGAALSTPTTATVTITGATPLPIPTGAMGETAASRLLHQATFGPTLSSIAAASVQTYDQWFAEQAGIAPSLISPSISNKDTDWYPLWLLNSVKGPDQLRQRTAFAMSQIFVVSDANGNLQFRNDALGSYYDMLVKSSLGNFRTLIENVTLSSAMGRYLSMFRNDKPNPSTGVHADENYAREVMQLFTIGLVELNLDGTPKLDSNGRQIPTYTQADVEGLARVFTGWASKPTGNSGEQAWQFADDFVNPMVAYENHHDTGAKTIVGGVFVPAGGTAATDLKIALDALFNHPNVGPFIGKQLIQRLVTSNPSPAYVARVASAFNNNGSGVRGDMLAVVKAILTDAEAVNVVGDGKLREPLLRLTNLWRAFDAADSNGKYNEGDILRQSSEFFAQAPLRSPSVFNFYRPDYQRAGQLTDAGLVAPEFQITNENTLVLTANRLQWQAYQYLDSTGKKRAGSNYDYSSNLSSGSVLLKTAAWEAFAATPATLVDKLNLVLMSGAMSPAMKNTLNSYISSIPANQPWARVAEAADIVINSPQYAVQR